MSSFLQMVVTIRRFNLKIIGRLSFLTLFLISGCSGTSSFLIEIGNQELTQILENNSGIFVYVGRPTCPACEKFEPILESTFWS
jgi:hypothetical protein